MSFGATPEEWAHFEMALSLGPDLLPVVSRPGAAISPHSKLKAAGKVPSRYDANHQVVGIADWTSHVASARDIDRWSAEPDYGISVITRNVRAIDCDLDDGTPQGVFAAEVHVAIDEFLQRDLPTRRRIGSSKFLLAFSMPGDAPKRVIKTAHGDIEFLATGQQFVAIGTHPSGVRYQWVGGLPEEIPELTLAQFDALWSALEQRFATEPSITSRVSGKAAKLVEAAAGDPVVAQLYERNLVKSTQTDGRINIICPFESEHLRESDDTATTYFPAFTGGYQRGHLKCMHSACEGRTDWDFLNALGMAPDMRDDFSASVPELGAIVLKSSTRYPLVNAMEFKAGVPPAWHIKEVLPHAEVVGVFGESGAGKSFIVLDMVSAVCRGIPWRGRKTKKGRVVYVVAEGASGFRNRINAYCAVNDVSALDLFVLAAAPSFMEGKDVTDLINAIRALGDVTVVVIDTLARVSAGANENSGEDMGRVLDHCSTIHKVTGATVLLIAHAGKDQSKGLRGWSGIKAALDAEIEITREDANRTARISKIKDGEGEGELFGFKLTTVAVGMDEDGDVVSSCVVEHGAAVSSKAKEKKLGKRQDLVWRLILEHQAPDNLGAIEPEVIEAYKDAVTLTATKDQRARHCIEAIDILAGMGKCKRVGPNRIVITGEAE